jgi:hypothetical protein
MLRASKPPVELQDIHHFLLLMNHSQHDDFPWRAISPEQTKAWHCDLPNEISAPNALPVSGTKGKS